MKTVKTIAGDFNSVRFKQLKRQYDTARVDKKSEFVFEGQRMLTKFAQYLIEYLDTQKL